MKTVIAAVAALTVFLPAPNASASPDCNHGAACQPRPYDGPLQSTWEVFPYGSDGGQAVQCAPATGKCASVATDPNGRR